MSLYKITSADEDSMGLSRQFDPIVGSYAEYINYYGCTISAAYQYFANAVEEFKVRDDDVWVCSFPKSGTTWTQEMVWCIANDLDFERAKIPIITRYPLLEHSCLYIKDGVINLEQKVKPEDLDSVNNLSNAPSPRFLKSHLPANLHPRQLRDGETKAKIIYVMRNPKDACISYFHYMKLVSKSEKTFDEHCSLFLKDAVPFAPYWNHVLSFWNKRNQPNVLLLKYEDMKRDLPTVVRKTAIFLGKDLTDDQVSSLTEHLSFASMKKNPAVNYKDRVALRQQLEEFTREGDFMRTGTTEQWKTEMSRK